MPLQFWLTRLLCADLFLPQGGAWFASRKAHRLAYAVQISHIGSVGRVAGSMIRGGGPLSELLASYLRSFAGSMERMSEAETAHGFGAVLHLLRGVMDRETGSPGDALSTVGLRSLAGAYIERRLHDPALTPDGIRVALKVSRTRLYKAFATNGGLAAAIRDARLNRARRRLSFRGALEKTITNIMLSCGYRDASAFSRAFKNRFGLAPRDYREAVRL